MVTESKSKRDMTRNADIAALKRILSMLSRIKDIVIRARLNLLVEECLDVLENEPLQSR